MDNKMSTEQIKIGDTVVVACDAGRPNVLRMTVEAIMNSTDKTVESEPKETSVVHVVYTVGNDVIQTKIKYGALKLLPAIIKIQNCGKNEGVGEIHDMGNEEVDGEVIELHCQ